MKFRSCDKKDDLVLELEWNPNLPSEAEIMALSFALDLIGGQVFELLSESVTRAVDRKAAFADLLQEMKYTLKSLKRQALVIQQIQEYNLELSLPNDEMIALVTQMTVGRQLIDRLSGIRFHVFNFCCINDLAHQLKELNSSLESLFDNLQLEQVRDIKETLKLSRQNRDDLEKMKVMLEKILQMIDDPEVKGLLKKLVEQNSGRSMKSSTSTSTLGSGSCTENEGNCITRVPSSKAQVEAAFGVLLNAVIEVKETTIMFRPLLQRLKSTLDYLLPLIGDMIQGNKALDLPKEELENMRVQMENGAVLVGNCVNVRRWTRNKKYIYTNQLFELDEYLQGQLSILLVQIARDVRETSVLIRNICDVVRRNENDMSEKEFEYKGCSNVFELSFPTVGPKTSMQATGDVMMETLVSVKKITEGVKGMEKISTVNEVSESLLATVGVEVLNMEGPKDVIKETQVSTEKTNAEVCLIQERAELGSVASSDSQQQTEESSGVDGTLGHYEPENTVSQSLLATVGVEVLNMEGPKDVIKETQVSTKNTNAEVCLIQERAEAQLGSIDSSDSRQQTEEISGVHGTLGHYEPENTVSQDTRSSYLPSSIPLEINALKKRNVDHDRPAQSETALIKSNSFKVHRLMCFELWNLVERISKLLSDIEAARLHCSMELQALCMLNRAIEKAKQLVQYCCESSKLYLALTGDVLVSRYKKSRNLLEQSLSLLQNWVPVILVAEISNIVYDLKAATFRLDPSEEEAGKVIRELLHQNASESNSIEDSELKALQLVSLRLHITSSKEILIEKRSIKKMLDKFGDSDHHKKQLLKYFLCLLKKYGKLILEKQTESSPVWQQGSLVSQNSGDEFGYNQNAKVEPHSGYGELEKQTESSPVWQQGSLVSRNSGDDFGYNQNAKVEPHSGYGENGAQRNMLLEAAPPEEFLCRISSRLMYDPVDIASGKTYERMWIQKWFDEENDTCPETNTKLAHLSLTPNNVMKGLISGWCTKFGVTITDPSMQPEVHCLWSDSEALSSWDNSSIASLGSSMNDLILMDPSAMSFRFLDTSSDSGTEDGSSLVQIDGDSLRLRYSKKSNTDLEFPSNISELKWESQCKAVEDVNYHLKCNPQASYAMSSKNFVEPLIKFIRDAYDQDDVEAQRNGFALLSTFLSKNQNGISYLCEDVSSLDSKVKEEGLAVMEILSVHQDCRGYISSPGALTSILKLLDSKIKSIQGKAIKVLYNLSFDGDICSEMVSSDCIPKLVPSLQDGAFSGTCISILKNLCDSERAMISIAETDGCIAQVVEVLDNGSKEHQEHAVDILFSLCSQRIEYCRLVMHEGVIPALVYSSTNGTERTRINSMEVLRLLRDIDYDHETESAELEGPRDNVNHSYAEKASKASEFSGKKSSTEIIASSLLPR